MTLKEYQEACERIWNMGKEPRPRLISPEEWERLNANEQEENPKLNKLRNEGM